LLPDILGTDDRLDRTGLFCKDCDAYRVQGKCADSGRAGASICLNMGLIR
jgi:hypothetical protein